MSHVPGSSPYWQVPIIQASFTGLPKSAWNGFAHEFTTWNAIKMKKKPRPDLLPVCRIVNQMRTEIVIHEQLTRRISHTSMRTKIRETTIIREGFLCISNCIGRNTEGTQISWKISSERYTAKTYLRWTSDVSREACMYAGEGSAAVHPSSSTRWRGVRGECVGGLLTHCMQAGGGGSSAHLRHQPGGGGGV